MVFVCNFTVAGREAGCILALADGESEWLVAAAVHPVLEPPAEHPFAFTRRCGRALGAEVGSRPPKAPAKWGGASATSLYASEHRAMLLFVKVSVESGQALWRRL